MKGPLQARFETNNHGLWGKMHEKGFSGLSAGSLKEQCECIDRSFIVVCMPYTPGFRAGEEEGKVCAVKPCVIAHTSSLLSALRIPIAPQR
jgi:hypothetical protein